MLAHHAAVSHFRDHRTAELALDGEVEVIIRRQLGGFMALEPGYVGAVRNRRIDEGRNCVRGKSLIQEKWRVKPVFGVEVLSVRVNAQRLCVEPLTEIRRRRNANRRRGSRSSVPRISQADVRTEAFIRNRPESGCPRNRPEPANNTAPGIPPAPGFGVVGPKSRPAVAETGRRQIAIPTQPEVQHQLGIDTPVVLEVAAEIIELLADETNRIDLPAIGVAEQERRESVAARIGIGSRGTPVS